MSSTNSSTAAVVIAVFCPLPQRFDYLWPFAQSAEPGQRVRVPFGRRELTGVVIKPLSHSAYDSSKLKAVSHIVDEKPLLDECMLTFLQWASRYYHAPIGDVFQTALPVTLRAGQAAKLSSETVWQLSAKGEHCSRDDFGRAKAQAELWQHFKQQPSRTLGSEQLRSINANWRSLVNKLQEKDLLISVEKVQQLHRNLTPTPGPSLNAQQQTAVSAINAKLGQFQTFLLEGVTGSGKTEVYLQTIQHYLDNDLQVLVLVPEIGLTPQLLQRFRSRLSATMVSMHSGLNDSERQNAWLQAQLGHARVVIGTRSALFTPLPDLGLIILDEEHDGSFKQQEGFRYHARDLAIKLAQLKTIPVVLGSATPALESLNHSDQRRFQRLELTHRAGNAKPPSVELIDARRQQYRDGLSAPLVHAIEGELKAGNQTLVFLNRRGFSPVLLCHDCGWTADCPHCDIRFTYHQQAQRLRCHHCGFEQAIPRQCKNCGSGELMTLGTGTERIEESLQQRFPSASILRIDRDTTRRKGALDDLLNQAHDGKAQILVGTQMMAKGHDFPNLTLAALLNVDQGLFSNDFRAMENLAQLIVQVGGRAGRAQKAGRVMLQTHHPEHPLLQTLLHHGYRTFAEQTLQERQAALLPPFAYLGLLRADSDKPELAEHFLQQVAKLCQPYASDQLFIIGPAPAPMEKRAGRYRHQLLLQAIQRPPLHHLLHHLLPEIRSLALSRKVRWSVDIDPIDLY